MATYETMIRMDENAFRAREKIQPKAVRKPLGDLTNSSKPPAKGNVPAKNATGSRTQVKIQPAVGRKPLKDVTNSIKPQAKVHSAKTSCTEVKIPSDVALEGFHHNHQEYIKAQNQCLSTDWFFETVGLQKEASASVAATSMLPASKLKLEIPLKFTDDEVEIPLKFTDDETEIAMCESPKLETPTPKSPKWNTDLEDSDFSGWLQEVESPNFKLMDRFE